jgi:hypothetical protein
MRAHSSCRDTLARRVLRSGKCSFDDKYANAVAAGGVAVAVINDAVGLFALPSSGKFEARVPLPHPSGPDDGGDDGSGDASSGGAAVPPNPSQSPAAVMVTRQAGSAIRRAASDAGERELYAWPCKFDASVRVFWDQIDDLMNHLVRRAVAACAL